VLAAVWLCDQVPQGHVLYFLLKASDSAFIIDAQSASHSVPPDIMSSLAGALDHYPQHAASDDVEMTAPQIPKEDSDDEEEQDEEMDDLFGNDNDAGPHRDARRV